MIYETLHTALVDQLGIEAELINPNVKLKADLELDSTETVILALEIKKHFKLDYTFPQEDVSLSELVAFVETHSAEAEAVL